jgi:hypothetical protein
MALSPRKVLFLEFNELTFTILDPLVEKGLLPHFARLKHEGAWGAPDAAEVPPHLDPWITWVTVHTGVTSKEHGAFVLEQDSATIRAKRLWDYAVEGGKSVGIFGSISAYPPRPVPGFMVPGPFAPSNSTYPAYLGPVQALNRKYTQVHQNNETEDGLFGMARRGADLLKLGVTPKTCARIALQLAHEKVDPHVKWRRVCLQPMLNFDVFEHLYRRYQPDLATWHTNHCAHFMHHYWRAWDDSKFLSPATEEEKRVYGSAIEYGYQVADELLARAMELVDDDTLLVLTTSMGQQPFVKEMYKDGKVPLRFKSLPKLLTAIGVEGVTEIVPTMIPEWNVRIPDPTLRKRAVELLLGVRTEGHHIKKGISCAENGEILTLAPFGLNGPPGKITYFFDATPGAKSAGYPMEDFFYVDAPTPKEGYHHPTGVLYLWGRGVSPGVELRDISNLDIAPTMLRAMGLPVPSLMKGRVLGEAWGEAAPPRAPSGEEHGSVAARHPANPS